MAPEGAIASPLAFALFDRVKNGDVDLVVFTRNVRKRTYGCRVITGKPGKYRLHPDLWTIAESDLRAVATGHPSPRGD